MSKHKRIILSVVLPVALLAIGGAAYFFWSKNSSRPVSVKQVESNTQDSQLAANQAVAVNADAAIAGGDVDRAKQVYSDAVSSASSDEQKGMLKLVEAKSFFGTQQYQLALDAGLQAVSYLKGEGSLVDAVSIVGGIYEAMGDKPNAIKYYQETVSVIDQTNNVNYPRQYYVDSVTRLEQG